MEKYKICPSCGTKNPPNLFECINCETDITNAPIIDEALEKSKIIKDQTGNNVVSQDKEVGSTEEDHIEEDHIEEDQPFVRICSCGERNPATAGKCRKCGADISGILPEPDTNKKCTFVLSSLDGKCIFEITKNFVIIGRECEMKEYLKEKRYVSRKHCKFVFIGDKLYVHNLNNTNHTYVNNEIIPENEDFLLNIGDEIGLGGCAIDGKRQDDAAYFVVKVG